ncbi:MAG: tryptophan synthase subunit alpha [Planctomycetes bacterium]|nr:tryptophan synthase subunit alpha [Planctomycetota bacterium]MBI3832926.1 tryptophan synthase subunit alpha [Planctomycetota bacterium]
MSASSQTVEQAIRLRLESGGKALVPFLTAGFPSAACFVDALRQTAESGCDVVEVGIPFSDPLADGPVVQHASQRCLDAGMTIRRALDLIHLAHVPIPVVIMSYLNPLLAFGCLRLTVDARAVGVRGFIVPDLPWTPQRRQRAACARQQIFRPSEISEQLRIAGFEVILLAAPTTPADRLRRIGGQTCGFLYAVSMTGVTGTRNRAPFETVKFLHRARAATRRPVLAGFGINSVSSATLIAAQSDGVIIGSALLEALQAGPRASAVARLGRFLTNVRNALLQGEGV